MLDRYLTMSLVDKCAAMVLSCLGSHCVTKSVTHGIKKIKKVSHRGVPKQKSTKHITADIFNRCDHLSGTERTKLSAYGPFFVALMGILSI